MLAEWIGLRGWSAQAMQQVRLGPTPQYPSGVPLTPALEAMLRNQLWYADLIVPTGTELLVVEAKVKAKPGAVGEVLWYASLVGTTPALAQYASLPVTPCVLFGTINPQLQAWANSLGVRVEYYTPPWLAQYVATH